MWQSWMKKLLESEILATTKLQLQSKTDLSMGEWISGILGKKTGEQVDRDGSRNRNRSRPSDFNYFVPEFFPPGTDPVRTDRRTSKSKQTWRPKFVSGLPENALELNFRPKKFLRFRFSSKLPVSTFSMKNKKPSLVGFEAMTLEFVTWVF